MILFGLDKSILKVYENKKNLFILYKFYSKNFSIFSAPPKKKTWLGVWMFSQRRIIWNTKFEKIKVQYECATVRSRIINCYEKITKWRLLTIFFEKCFLIDLSVHTSSKNQKFYSILGLTVAIRLPNMYIKFCKDLVRIVSSHGEKINTAWKK